MRRKAERRNGSRKRGCARVTLVLIASCVVMAVVTRGVAETDAYRTWRSTSGSTLKARLVFHYGNWVRLAKPDGGEVAIKTGFLSDADRRYLTNRHSLRSTEDRTDKVKKPAKLDINGASFDELKFLPRIGDTLAHRIIDARPYRRVSDLLAVEGIGAKTYAGIRREVTVRKPKKKRGE